MSFNLLRARQEQRRQRKKQNRRMYVMTALICLIAFCTTYALILPAITMQGEIWCGKDDHAHEESCYQSNLLCTLPEEENGHVHIEDCFEQVLICQMEEHQHEEHCYINPNAEEPAEVPKEEEQEKEVVVETEVTESTPRRFALSPRAITELAAQYGNYHFSYNETKNAFTKDAAYAKYYNEDSPLGVAGSFHIVAFDTATLSTHTNGNVLAHTLRANSNLGTNNYADELSYVVNYQKLNSTSASMNGHSLVVGSENTVHIGGNRDIIYVNNVKIDRPYNIVQDVDSEKTPFIDLTAVNIEVAGISSRLEAAADYGVTTSFADQNNRSIHLNNPSDVGVYSIKASDLNQYANNPMRLTGFTKDGNGSLIINVDCSGTDVVKLPPATIFIDGQEQSTNEVTEFSNGKVIWNFINASGATIETNRMTGMVIALGATVNINQNLNGTVIAENVNVKAESHRTDFTGHIELLKDSGIAIRKVDSDNIGIYLDEAEFTLKKWNGTAYETIAEGLTTDEDGLLAINHIEYNTAYQLIETKAPPGYQLNSTPYEFYVPHSNTSTYPEKKPTGFSGKVHKEQAIKNIKNEKADVLSITVSKEWYIDETKVTWIDGLVNINVYQKVFADIDRTQEITSVSNRVYAKNIEIDSHNGWKIKLDNLPRSATETIAGSKMKVYYSYYVKEVPVRGFTASYENNEGITSGNINVINCSDSFDEPKVTQLQLKKEWYNFDEDLMEPPLYSNAVIQLYQTAYEDAYFHHQIGETISYGAPIELSNSNNWTHTVTNLPEYELITNEDGKPQVVYYAYTAKEVSVGGYMDTYVNNGTYHGTITIKNTQKDHPTYLIVRKFWKDENGNAEVKDGYITVDVYQKIYKFVDEETFDETEYYGSKLYREDIKIESKNGWKGSVDNLPLHGWMIRDGKRVQVSYTYYVQEKEIDGYKSTYENNQGITEGTITITNKALSYYSLPETGGMGTNLLTVFGILLIAVSICGYFLYHRIFQKMKGRA